MAEVVLKLRLPPLEGFLYFVERDCTVWKHQGSAKECVSDKTFERDEGYLYFIDLNGDLARLPDPQKRDPETNALFRPGTQVSADESSD
ncbi:MAG: hypothetical protein QF883_00840 [Candidatus Poseidoniia archaeon]|jgi:hypothetical protein|nr:hypothetical protein [Candidatus Poseidoniia archaeon]MDP7136410.1 hypothetical protein [Candidatus Poseidoniia archaeon]MDP7243523.1 hypothetical protein [Candidatus Poseidoniia archaeon]MDP7607849.1 hypothetical protein [Candidatus Poseidoniia archaeon]HJP44064.1 hypothetical protein [Candidatus Poseidoniia archaeon]